MFEKEKAVAAIAYDRGCDVETAVHAYDAMDEDRRTYFHRRYGEVCAYEEAEAAEAIASLRAAVPKNHRFWS